MLPNSPGKEESLVPARASASSPAGYYAAEFVKIGQEFEARGEGQAALRARSNLVDEVVVELYRQLVSSELYKPKNLCLVALGGYGRRELFPHSDIDLLFLTENIRPQDSHREALAALLRALWDLRLRMGHSTHTLAECGRLHRDNLEFNVALLDSRYLVGDPRLFAHLHDEIVPHLVARDHQDLLRNLADLARRRYAEHGHTIFHLEPDVKEAPGGLRDYHLCRWLALIAELQKHGRWTMPEDSWPAQFRAESLRAFEFLASVRCFLHYLRGRDDNQLSYEFQDQAAARGIGWGAGKALATADWMRHYFRQARSIHGLATRLLDEVPPAHSSLYGVLRDWKSRLSNPDFSVVRGRIFPRQPSAFEKDPSLLLRLFEMAARHSLEVSREAERLIEEALSRRAEKAAHLPTLWQNLRQILTLPHAGQALRDMHRLGVLGALFPEFHVIDSLVIRDFYHRYTVDEHSFTTIENLHALAATRSGSAESHGPRAAPSWEQKFAEILSELEQPELLFFSLLFHDVGKGMPDADHIQGSLRAVDTVMTRLELAPQDRQTVRFLVAQHLEMSATLQRRDVFDPETVRAFAERVETPERLKLLCLFTYADIKGVSPEALTPWKAELLWQLYTAAANYLARSVDEARVRPPGTEPAQVEGILWLLPVPATAHELLAFLEGFPRRYLATHPPEEVAAHFALARRLAGEPVQVELRTRNHLHELTVVTADRSRLFADITGTLAAWGMNILKADAYANAAGIVLDTFRFVDLHRTLEMNPSESERLKANLVDVLGSKLELQKLLSGRISPAALPRAKIKIPTQVRFDDPPAGSAGASHCTLLELIAQDRPGLLYQVSSVLSGLGCSIEIALIDTEGQKAIDVFYLTSAGAQLDSAKQQAIRDALLRQL